MVAADEEPLLREVLLGFMRIHVLHHASHEPVYGLWMRDELVSHGYEIGVGVLYPMLHSLEERGYLTSEHRTVRGHRRRYYTATAAGHRVLAQLRVKLRELVDEAAPPADE